MEVKELTPCGLENSSVIYSWPSVYDVVCIYVSLLPTFLHPWIQLTKDLWHSSIYG